MFSGVPRLRLHEDTHMSTHGQSSDPKWSISLSVQPVIQCKALQDQRKSHYEQIRDIQEVGTAEGDGEGRESGVGE